MPATLEETSSNGVAVGALESSNRDMPRPKDVKRLTTEIDRCATANRPAKRRNFSRGEDMAPNV